MLSSIERLITPESIEEPVLVLIVGSVGLALNVLSAAVVHGQFRDERLKRASLTCFSFPEHGDGGDGHSHSHSHNKTATVANLAENSKAEADDSVHVQDEETLRASAVLSLSARGDEVKDVIDKQRQRLTKRPYSTHCTYTRYDRRETSMEWT